MENLNTKYMPPFSVGNELETIGGDAFSWCASLASITIPASVTSIGFDAFSGCTSLTIYVRGYTEKPAGWSDYWNYGNRPVVWDYQG